MTDQHLIQIDLPGFCAGCVVGADGLVTHECAPILRRWIGLHGRRLVLWARSKGGTATWQKLPPP